MLNPRNPRTPRSGHDHVPTHVPAACRFCLTCPEGYSLPRTPRKKFDPTIYYGPRATPEPGKPWWYLVFLGIQFPPYAHGIGASRNLFAPDCTGIGMFQGPASSPHAPESVRHATVLQREWYTTVRNCLRTCPCPCHGNGTPCNPLNPRNLLQPFEHVGLVGKRCAMETEESEGAKSVSH